MNLKIISFLLLAFFIVPSTAEELNYKITILSLIFIQECLILVMMVKRSTLIGFQHQNEELNRDTFLGNLSPITGAMITADNATYFYTGVQAQLYIGLLNYYLVLHQVL